jgi:hypothetical protein
MNIIDTLVEIRLKEEQDFLKIKETLTRIGVASKKENKLWQSCHILHKKGAYYIVHFKELFALDGKQTDFSDEDKGRRNTIATLLEEWGLCSIVDKTKVQEPKAAMNQVKIIPYKEKESWILEAKYSIGKSKKG